MLFKSTKKGDRVAHELPAGKVVPALVEKVTPKYLYLDRGLRYRREDGTQHGGERRYGLGGARIRPITFADLAAWDAEATRADRARAANLLAQQIQSINAILTEDDISAISEILRRAESRSEKETK